MDQFQYALHPKLKIFGDGMQTRDFVYVKDVVRANILVANSENAIGKVFNVGSGKSSSLLDMVAILENLSSRKAEICFESPRPGDIKDSVADISELEGAGYVPAYDLESGLKTYWNMKETYNLGTDRAVSMNPEL
jgi:UDP-glucose 4-epimerase